MLLGAVAVAGLMGACASGGGVAGGEGARASRERSFAPGMHAFREVTPSGSMAYTVWLPPGFDEAVRREPGKRWPLIIAFHGSGESGTDGSKQVWQGLGLALLHNPERFGAIVVMPQKSDKREWDQFDDLAWAVMDRVMREWPVDEARVVLTGVSQGGKACWHFGSQQAGRFAGLAPVAARSVTEAEADAIARAGLPVWLSHGGQDPVIKFSEAEVSEARLRARGVRVQTTHYPDAGHVSWHEFYADERVAAWLWEHHPSWAGGLTAVRKGSVVR